MAEVKMIRLLFSAALALGACVGICGWNLAAQQATGSLAGRLTDLHSLPLANVAVVLRNEATGAETHTTTQHNGEYRAEGLLPGSYTILAASPAHGQGELNGILVQAGHETRVQTAMAFAPLPPKPLEPPAVVAQPETSAERVVRGTPALPANAALPVRPETPPAALPPAAAAKPGDVPARQALATQQPASPRSPVAADAAPAEPVPIEAASAETRQPICAPTPAASLPAAARPAGSAAPRQTTQLDAARARAAAEAGRQRFAAAQTETRAALAQPAPTEALTSATLSAAELQQLPVNGRRWEEFLDDAPAATPAAAAGRAGMRGPGQAATGTSVDGINTQLAFGAPSGQGLNASAEPEGRPEGTGSALAGGRGLAVSEAAIRSLEIASNNAETNASRAAGGQTQLVTLRGTEGLHGQGFFFARSNTLGAQNPFTRWVRETAAGTATALPTFTAEPYTPPDHATVFGLGVGRQLRKNRWFWFAALDSAQRDHPGVATLKHPDLFFAVPTNDQMQLLGAQIGSGSQAIPSYSWMLETLSGLLGPAPRTTSQWMGFARLDGEFGERHRVTLEGNAAHWDAPGGGFQRVSEAYGNHSFGSSQAGEQWGALRWEAFLTPNLLAVTQLAWNRTLLSAHAATPSAYEQTLNITNWGQLPQIEVDSRYGFTIGNPAQFGSGSYPDERSLHVQEEVSWARAPVLLKGGFQLDHTMDHTSLLRNQTGTYHYATLENFAADALAFKSLGISGSLNKFNQHNCDQTGKAWRDSGGGLRGLGYLPCYSYYTQTMGPANWYASTNEAALYVTAQWQPVRFAVFSAGLRWEREQVPAPIAAVDNPALPLTEQTPELGNNWGPRLSLALGPADRHGPVLRLGYGMYYGRLMNSTLLTVLSHTGSFNGDLSFYLRPTDNLAGGGAPPFPDVFSGEPLSVVKPGAVEFAPNFRNPEVHQAVAGVEQKLPLHMEVRAAAMVSLARHLPITVDTNIDPAANPGSVTYSVVDATGLGPIKAPYITLPFYASWPVTGGTVGRLNTSYQQVVEMQSRANSTYEAATVRLVRYGQHGLSFHAHYTYAHAMDWNPNESLRLTGGSLLDPANFRLEYGTSNLDVRHAAMLLAFYETPWKLKGVGGWMANGWTLAGVGHYRSGLPYTIRTAGTLSKTFVASTGTPIVALGTGINGSGGDNRIYGTGSDGVSYNLGRNTYRAAATWKADLRLAKRINFSARRQLELMVESFNLLNHQNVTELETVGYTIESGTSEGGRPSLNFLNGLKAGTSAFGQPFNVNATNFYTPRQMEFGVRIRF